MPNETAALSGIGRGLLSDKRVQFLEIFLVFAVAAGIIFGGLPLVGENLFAKQLVIFAANVVMLVMVWFGLRLRGQTWEHFGLTFRFQGWRPVLFAFLKSLPVLVFGVAAFIVGAIIMANIVGVPEQADMSGYAFLKGNLPMLILSLASIYVISSFGEEVVYRGFLINRIEELGGKTKTALRAAVVISAVIFGVAHFGWGIVGVVQTFFMGFALAVSYLLVKRNLWVLVLAHAVMDTMLIVPLYFA